MTTIYPNLQKELSEHNISFDSLKDELESSGETLSYKLQGVLPWELVDVVRICRLLRNSDVDFLFCTVR